MHPYNRQVQRHDPRTSDIEAEAEAKKRKIQASVLSFPLTISVLVMYAAERRSDVKVQ